ERAPLRSGADHRHGCGRLHAAGRGRLLRLLRDHARRYRGRLARDAAVPGGGAHRLAHRRVRTVVRFVPAALFRFSRLTLSRICEDGFKGGGMDRRTFLKTGAGAGLSLGAPYIARGQAPLTLRWAHFAPEDHPANVAAKQFASRVEARTNGAIKVNIFPNNVLGGPPEQAQQIKLGTIDMGLPTQGQLDKFDTAFAAVMLPFVFDSPAHVYRVLDGPGMDWLAPLAEKQGFILLRNWEYGFRNVTNSVRPINVPDDVEGLKIRTPPELQI